MLCYKSGEIEGTLPGKNDLFLQKFKQNMGQTYDKLQLFIRAADHTEVSHNIIQEENLTENRLKATEFLCGRQKPITVSTIGNSNFTLFNGLQCINEQTTDKALSVQANTHNDHAYHSTSNYIPISDSGEEMTDLPDIANTDLCATRFVTVQREHQQSLSINN